MIEPWVSEAPQVWLDAQLAVVQLNAAARSLLAAQPQVLALQAGRLHAPADPKGLARSLAAAAGGGRAALALARPGQLPLTLRAARVQAADGTRLVVALRDPELELPDLELLQALFGLTPTEALVARALAQGLDSAALARTMGVKPNTVQSHIKRVLVKSGTRRQSQLVSLILRSAIMPLPALAAAIRPQPPAPAPTGSAGPGPRQPEPAGCDLR